MKNFFNHKLRKRSPIEIVGIVLFGIVAITGLAILFGFTGYSSRYLGQRSWHVFGVFGSWDSIMYPPTCVSILLVTLKQPFNFRFR